MLCIFIHNYIIYGLWRCAWDGIFSHPCWKQQGDSSPPSRLIHLDLAAMKSVIKLLDFETQKNTMKCASFHLHFNFVLLVRLNIYALQTINFLLKWCTLGIICGIIRSKLYLTQKNTLYPPLIFSHNMLLFTLWDTRKY